MSIDDWKTFHEAALTGFSDAILCIATMEIVERGNRDSVRDGLSDGEAGEAGRILLDGALLRMHIHVCRAYAGVRKDDRHLRAAIEFLKKPGRIAEAKPPDRPDALAEAIVLFDEASLDPRLERLKHMRDKLIAHLGSYDKGMGPSYNDLFAFARLTVCVWETLARGASIFVDLGQEAKFRRDDADAFWSPWEKPAAIPE